MDFFGDAADNNSKITFSNISKNKMSDSDFNEFNVFIDGTIFQPTIDFILFI